MTTWSCCPIINGCMGLTVASSIQVNSQLKFSRICVSPTRCNKEITKEFCQVQSYLCFCSKVMGCHTQDVLVATIGGNNHPSLGICSLAFNSPIDCVSL